jgi:hypothetical protein
MVESWDACGVSGGQGEGFRWGEIATTTIKRMPSR